MNQLRTISRLIQQWNAVLPLLCVLLGIAIHNGFRQGDLIAVIVAIFAVAAVYTLAPFTQLIAITPFAPLLLGFVYTVVPYVFGLANLGALPSGTDYLWLAGLYSLGVGSSVLQKSGETTTKKVPASAFVARFSKDWACFAGLAATTLGSILFIWQVRGVLWLVAAIAMLLGALAYIIVQLADTPEGEPTRTTVVAADTLLHGIIITLIAAYVCITSGASTMVSGTVSSAITLLFLYVFFWFIAHPHRPARKRRAA